jgi:hypothetical protein
MSLRRLLWACGLLALSGAALATEPGQLVLPDFSALADKAAHSVVISLDPSLLGLAGGLLSADPNPNDAAVKELASGLRGIYVRSFSFDHDGAYSRRDVDTVRAQLTSPAWQPLVSTHDRSQHNDVDIYIRRDGQRTQGMAIISTAPRAVTIVNIVGSIDLAKLAQLEGQFGIPRVGASSESPGNDGAVEHKAQPPSGSTPNQ